MNIRNEFSIGETVYLTTDNQQEEFIVVEIIIEQKGIKYTIRNRFEFLTVYDFEISRERDQNKVLGIDA